MSRQPRGFSHRLLSWAALRVLLIDNYDSFAFNLVQALAVLGAEVDVRRNDATTVAEALAVPPAAVVLSPGPCGPPEAGVSVPLIRACATQGVPLLGVCLGHQSIAAAFGGAVIRASRLVHGKTARIAHQGSGVFRGLPSPFDATRYHSLVAATPLPSELVPTAWVDPVSGGLPDELMGLSHRSLPIHGVQFHPESYLTAHGADLLANFLELATRPAPGGIVC